ncbi:hypothetical protein [Glycomyces buryatensis]|uniref:Sulfotransferase family protein n=1 Tax=Glycomyces buryatensis TaxID=2570927 RepID=A0A4S8PQZ4_9ACTN|nr:hypothetical protein [Glycomyces buryatensis]THV33577.1 hypothetical protein FAB82_25915 [Glycomyces buryatensis]
MPSFPAGSTLLHVGPPKTGTTSLQDALDAADERLRELGVALPGGCSNPTVAVNGGTGVFKGPNYDQAWRGLVDAVKRSESRIQVISSEHFAHARADDARRIVETLGGPTVRVVITLRPLQEILPSLWQQFVQSGEADPFPIWLKRVLSDLPTDEHSDRYLTQIWQRQYIERWAAAAGPQNVTVVVVDRHRPEDLLRQFETMIGVSEGLLTIPERRRNESLNLAEVELLQDCYAELRDLGWAKHDARRYLLFGAATRIRTTQTQRPTARDIVTPDWAQERAVELGTELAALLPTMGVDVVGDPTRLRGAVVRKSVEPIPLDSSAAVQAVIGVLQIAAEDRDLAARSREGEQSETDRALRAATTHSKRVERELRAERAKVEEALRQRDALAAIPDAVRTRSAELLRILRRRAIRKLWPRAR